MYIIGCSRIAYTSDKPLTYPLLTPYFPFPLLTLYFTPVREVLFVVQRYCFMHTYANNYVAKYATNVAVQQM